MAKWQTPKFKYWALNSEIVFFFCIVQWRRLPNSAYIDVISYLWGSITSPSFWKFASARKCFSYRIQYISNTVGSFGGEKKSLLTFAIAFVCIRVENNFSYFCLFPYSLSSSITISYQAKMCVFHFFFPMYTRI